LAIRNPQWIDQSSHLNLQTVLDYEMELVAENFEIEEMAKTQPICIRMEKWLIRDLKEIAAEEGFPYQTIMKECLKKLVKTRKRRKTAVTNVAS